MKLKVITVFMLTLLLTSTLTVAFNIPPIIADTGIAGIRDNYPTTQEAEAGNRPIQASSHTSSQNQNFSSEASQEGNPEPVAKDKCDYDETEKRSDYQWNLNETDEWADFANVDDDSAELVIGINDAEPSNYNEITCFITENGGNLVSTVSMEGKIRAVVADIPLVAVSSFVTEVQAAGLSRYIEPNMKFQHTFVPNDPYWSRQWGPRNIEADYVWNTTVGDPSVLVAVIDTGIDWDHPDIAANYVPLGYDWVNDDPDPMDDDGHGTHCAGIVAAVINNSIGIAGLAQVGIMAEKGLDAGGWGTEDDLANAIVHAVDCGADILSNSWGGYGESALIHEAIEYAYEAGVLVVAAAGNDATSIKHYPAAHDEVIAVSATQDDDNPVWWTNFGDWIELAAPGVNIYSTVWDNSYTSMSGTSMAAPHVAGVAALVWSWFPNTTRDWVRLWLQYTADDLGDPGFDVYYGHGRVNARKAVEKTPPDHDLFILNWERPPYVEPGMLVTLNTTVFNFGASNETDVTVQLLVNGSVVDSELIGFLATGESATVGCSWSSTVEGMYNFTSFVMPVPGETIIENNVVWAYVYVGFPVKAYVLDSAGTYLGDIITNWQVLNTYWYVYGDTMVYIDYTTLSIDDITYDDIAATCADVLIISCAYAWEFTNSEIKAITRYICEGHGLIATAGTLYYGVPNNNKLAPLFGLNGTISWTMTSTDLLHLRNPTHPLFANVPDPYCFPGVGTTLPSDGRWDENELAGGTYVALGHYEESAIIVYRGLVYISPWLEIIPSYYHFHLQLLYNAITWSSYEKPEHELIVHLGSPPALKPGNSTMLNATVYNMGLGNETTVELQLLIDGSIVDSVTIPELLVGASYTLSCSWTPTVEGTYNVTAYAPPLPSEELMENNVESASVLVYYMLVALFKNVDPWDYSSNEEALSLYRIPYVVFSSKDFGSIDLTLFSKVVIASDQDQAFYYAMDDYRWWFEDYVNNGGLLEIHAADWGWHGGSWVGTLPGGLQWVHDSSDHVTIVDPTHPVVTMPNPITDAELDYWRSSVHGYFTNYTVDSRIVIIEDYTGYPAYLEFEYGAGFILASSQTLEWAYMHRYSLILENSLLYCKFPHELAVFLEAPTYVQPGDSTLLNATVYNLGLTNESDVELQLLINSSLVNSVVILELVSGTSHTLSYMWTPTVEATYNVTAYAPPVLGEDFTTNNVATKIVCVRPLRYVLFDQTHGTDSITSYNTWVSNLTERGYVVNTYISGSINSAILAGYDVFVIPQAHDLYTSDELSTIQDFVIAGGGLLVIGDDAPYIYTYLTGFAGISWMRGGVSGITTDITPHEVTQGVSSVYLDAPVAVMTVTGIAEDLVRDPAGDIMLAISENFGRVIGFADEGSLWNYGIILEDNMLLANNMIDWLVVRHEHDLAVALEAPALLEPGDLSPLNATVQNRGLRDETDVELFLLINDTPVSNTTIPELLTGSTYTLSYLWIPTVEATYNVTAYAPPLTGENVTANNFVSKIVNVRYATVALISDQSELLAITPILDSMGVGYDIYNDNGIYLYTENLSLLLSYNVVIFNSHDRMITLSEHSALKSYLYSGGNLLVTGYDSLGHPDDPLLADIVCSSSVGDDTGEPDLYVTDETHPIMNGPYGGFPAGYHVSGLCSDCDAAEADLTRNAITVAELADGYDKIIATGQLPGKVVYWNGEGSDDWIQNTDCEVMFKNTISWMKPPPIPEHELAVLLGAPSYLIPDTSTMLRATVYNGGLSNETNVELELLMNGSVVSSTVIDELLSNSSYTLTYLWAPTEGTYNVTAYAHPVPDEDILANNVAMKMVNVFTIVEPYVFVNPLDSIVLRYRLFTINITIGNVTDLYMWQIKLYFDPTILDCTGAWYPEDHVFAGRPFIPAEPIIDHDIEGTYVMLGCSLIGMIPGFNGTGTLCQIGFRSINCGSSTLRFSRPIPDDTFLWDSYLEFISFIVIDGFVDVVRHMPPLPPIACFTYSPLKPLVNQLITFDATLSTPDGAIMNYTWNFDDGNVTTTTRPIITHYYTSGGTYNVTLKVADSQGFTDSTWTQVIVGIRDVAVLRVAATPTQAYVGQPVNVNVTAANEGNATETFTITLYYNFTTNATIGTQIVTNLTPGENKTLTFIWNTTGVKPCNNYTITAVASTVPGETDVADNTLSDGKVKIKIWGDINGDGKVDMRDIATIAKTFGSYPGHTRWNPDLDFNNDGKIDMKDIVVVARNFGKCI